MDKTLLKKSRMSEVLCYQFQLNKFTLNITESTIQNLNNFVLRTGFHQIQLQSASKIIRAMSRDGLLTKTQFDSAMERLLVKAALSDKDRIECSMTLSSIFYSFDRTDSDVVDALDLIAGIAVLCEG